MPNFLSFILCFLSFFICTGQVNKCNIKFDLATKFSNKAIPFSLPIVTDSFPRPISSNIVFKMNLALDDENADKKTKDMLKMLSNLVGEENNPLNKLKNMNFSFSSLYMYNSNHRIDTAILLMNNLGDSVKQTIISLFEQHPEQGIKILQEELEKAEDNLELEAELSKTRYINDVLLLPRYNTKGQIIELVRPNTSLLVSYENNSSTSKLLSHVEYDDKDRIRNILTIDSSLIYDSEGEIKVQTIKTSKTEIVYVDNYIVRTITTTNCNCNENGKVKKTEFKFDKHFNLSNEKSTLFDSNGKEIESLQYSYEYDLDNYNPDLFRSNIDLILLFSQGGSSISSNSLKSTVSNNSKNENKISNVKTSNASSKCEVLETISTTDDKKVKSTTTTQYNY